MNEMVGCVISFLHHNTSLSHILGFESDDPHAGAYEVQTTVVQTGNNVLNGKQYQLQPIKWQTTYLDNTRNEHCPNIQPNLYNDPECKNRFDKVIFSKFIDD